MENIAQNKISYSMQPNFWSFLVHKTQLINRNSKKKFCNFSVGIKIKKKKIIGLYKSRDIPLKISKIRNSR